MGGPMLGLWGHPNTLGLGIRCILLSLIFTIVTAQAAVANEANTHVSNYGAVISKAEKVKNSAEKVSVCLSDALSYASNSEYAIVCECEAAKKADADVIAELFECANQNVIAAETAGQDLKTALAAFLEARSAQRLEITRVIAGDLSNSALQCPKGENTNPLDYLRHRCSAANDSDNNAKIGASFCVLSSLTIVNVCGGQDPAPQSEAKDKGIQVTYSCDEIIQKTATISNNGTLSILCP